MPPDAWRAPCDDAAKRTAPRGDTSRSRRCLPRCAIAPARIPLTHAAIRQHLLLHRATPRRGVTRPETPSAAAPCAFPSVVTSMRCTDEVVILGSAILALVPDGTRWRFSWSRAAGHTRSNPARAREQPGSAPTKGTIILHKVDAAAAASLRVETFPISTRAAFPPWLRAGATSAREPAGTERTSGPARHARWPVTLPLGACSGRLRPRVCGARPYPLKKTSPSRRKKATSAHRMLYTRPPGPLPKHTRWVAGLEK
jgi:hypothetical protein